MRSWKNKVLVLLVSLALVIHIFHVPVFALSASGYENRIKNFKTEGYVSTGDKATDLISFAKNQVGKTGKELGYDDNWCAAYISDCAKYVGCDWKWTATPSAFKSVGTVIYTRGDESPSVEPQAGDLALIDWSNNSNDCGHVEIVTGYIPVSECKQTEGNGKIGGLITIGGNTGSSGYSGNAVKVRKNPVNTNWGGSNNFYNCILYIVRPNYDKIPTVTPTPVPTPSSTMPASGQGTNNKTYIAPRISDLRVVYSGYKYIEVEATIYDAGQGIVRYEIGTWDGGLFSTFTPRGTTRVEGNKIKCSVPVDINESFYAIAKYFPLDLKIGIRSYDSSDNVHYALGEKISYQYRLPIPTAIKKVNNHTYYRFDHGYTWEDANEFAKSIANGRLVSIDSVNENNAVSSLVSDGSSYAYYTGGKYDLSGKWTWTDNSAFSYTNWISGQPNVSSGQRDALIITEDGWAAYSSKFKNLLGFIVEVENETKQLPTAYPTLSPTPEPTATPTPKPVIKVTDAVKKTIKNHGIDAKFQVRIPKVSISGKNLDSVNKKIRKEADKRVAKYEEGVAYTYYVNDKVISILMMFHGFKDFDITYKVYNISIETGKLLSDAAFIKLYGITDKEFFDMVKQHYSKDTFGITKVGKKYTKKELQRIKNLRKKNLKRVSYKYVHPYLTKWGKLDFAGSIYWYNLESDETALGQSIYDDKTSNYFWKLIDKE